MLTKHCASHGKTIVADDSRENQTTATERREFFWSARTLRCDVWVADDVLGEFLDRTEDVLGRDGDGCIFAYEPYDKLIPQLLNQHIGVQSRAK